MSNSLRILTLSALGALGVALAGCETSGGGGGGGGGGPAPAPIPQYEYQWIGTAPFCAATPSDCSTLGSGWSYERSSPIGDGVGAVCSVGTKVQCKRQIN